MTSPVQRKASWGGLLEAVGLSQAPSANDPEGLFLELALTRGLIERGTAQAVMNARARNPAGGSVPDLLLRSGHLSPQSVAGLKAEVIAYMRSRGALSGSSPDARRTGSNPDARRTG